MKKIVKKLVLYYLAFVIIKSILSYFIPAPSGFSDEYIYAKLARSFFFDFNFTVHNFFFNISHPLYFITLSPAYLFSKMTLIYPAMKVINSIISSLVIFPAFLISREFFNSNKSFKIAILISLLPSNFIFSSYILTENIFYPLFLFSIYLIYKSLISEKLIWPILAGIAIGLTYLSRIVGIVLFAAIGMVFLFRLIKKEKIFLKNTIIMCSTSLLIISPFLLQNILTQGSVLGGYTAEASTIFELNKFLPKYSIQFILYLGLMILSTGVLFPLLISKKIFNKETITFSIVTLTSIFTTLIIAANHNVTILPNLLLDLPANYLPWLAGRLIGRYIDVILPLVIILGFICIKEKISLRKTIIFSTILLFSSQMVLTRLFPINHVSTVHLGLFNHLLLFITNFPINMLIVGIILGIIPFILYKIKFNFQKIFSLFMLLFILLNILNFTLIYYNSNEFWYKGDQMQLGLWLESHDPEISTVLFDKRDCISALTKLNQKSICQPSGKSTIIGFWLNDNIIVDDPNNVENVDFIISRHKLDFPIIKTSKDNIYIYSLKGN
ncbi:MAG: hypothetical protein CMH64_00275 [Nanoarchaeota archaeon]|nr:hypothetical protein [Nanoarchaeota archaeon]